MKIIVTRKHIKKGRMGSCSKCPVALALYEKIHKIVAVDTIDIMYKGNQGQWYTADTPDDVAAFIEDFDSTYPVKPFTFEVDFRKSHWAAGGMIP